MKIEFCMTILKEENRGLTLVNYRSRNPTFKRSFGVES